MFARRMWKGSTKLAVHLRGNEGIERSAVSSVIPYISGFNVVDQLFCNCFIKFRKILKKRHTSSGSSAMAMRPVFKAHKVHQVLEIADIVALFLRPSSLRSMPSTAFLASISQS